MRPLTSYSEACFWGSSGLYPELQGRMFFVSAQ
jgi:hypothetical protein